MHTRLADAPTKRQYIPADSVAGAPPPARLRVRFVSGCDPRIAEQAARCMVALARGRLDIDVAPGAGDRDPAAAPSLVVVIHVAGGPAPLVADECGGRIDWHLECEALSENTVELTRRLRRHNARLLGDLGYPVPACPLRHEAYPARADVPSPPALLAAA